MLLNDVKKHVNLGFVITAFAEGWLGESGAAHLLWREMASATGNEVIADAGNPVGSAPDITGSSFDFANAFGGGGNLSTVAEASAGFNGSGDSASAVGQNVIAVAGDSNTAAAPANFDSASVLGSLSAPTTGPTEAVAGSVTGLGGSSDTAFVDDPFGTLGSTALAGLGHNFDLAGVFGDNLNADSIGVDFIAHILPFF